MTSLCEFADGDGICVGREEGAEAGGFERVRAHRLMHEYVRISREILDARADPRVSADAHSSRGLDAITDCGRDFAMFDEASRDAPWSRVEDIAAFGRRLERPDLNCRAFQSGEHALINEHGVVVALEHRASELRTRAFRCNYDKRIVGTVDPSGNGE